MTVKKLKEILANLNDEMEIYISRPSDTKSTQENHEDYGVSYVAYDGERLWFETYGSEDITEELNAIGNEAIDHGWSDNDFFDEVFDKHGHGYTVEDIKKNGTNDMIEFFDNSEYAREEYGFEL